MGTMTLNSGMGIDGQFPFRNWLFKNKMELELINFELELNPQISLSFNFLIQKYFFHDNPTWNAYS